MARANPQNIITPDAFAVAPHLLGIALARPSRRLMAIAIDGVLLAILANVGGKLLFTSATAILLWRTAASFTGGKPGLVKMSLRIASVVLITIFLALAYGRVADGFGDGSGDGDSPSDSSAAAGADSATDSLTRGVPAGAPAVPGSEPNIDLGKLGLSFRDTRVMLLFADIGRAPDSAAAAPLADSLSRWIDARPAETRAQLAEGMVNALEEAPGHAAVIASMARHLPADTFPPGDSIRRQLAAATARLERVERDNKRLEEQVENAEEGFTFRKMLRSVSDVAGFGLGWSALYFTGFMLLMRGQTPGKKLLGIRVIRLDGRPLSTWIAFERFGGYAASTATGLLGFAQILWDRNRQALHDKATETVVIREQNGVPVKPVA